MGRSGGRIFFSLNPGLVRILVLGYLSCAGVLVRALVLGYLTTWTWVRVLSRGTCPRPCLGTWVLGLDFLGLGLTWLFLLNSEAKYLISRPNLNSASFIWKSQLDKNKSRDTVMFYTVSQNLGLSNFRNSIRQEPNVGFDNSPRIDGISAHEKHSQKKQRAKIN
jgi:hypothetical protein